MTDHTGFPVCLTIAGLDPSGGAGIVADIKTFSAFGCFGAAAVTSVTFQNTTAVFGAVNESAETVRRQVDPVFDDLRVAGVKTGMLPTAEVIREVAAIVRERRVQNLVVDPVVRSTSGYDLISDEALYVLVKEVFPLALVVTPNIPETERITGTRIGDADSIAAAASEMHRLGARGVLIKGGHDESDKMAVDRLFIDGEVHMFEAERINADSTHGTGCTLSAAITAGLANGADLISAVRTAKRYVTEAIRTAPNIGHGHSPVNHLVKPK